MTTQTGITVEEAIHRRWAESAELCALLPADRLTTGPSQAEGDQEILPRGELSRTANTAAWRSSSGRGDDSAIRIQFWVIDHADGGPIVRLIKGDKQTPGVFENVEWDCGDLHIECCRVENDYFIQEDDGVWQFIVDLQIQTQ